VRNHSLTRLILSLAACGAYALASAAPAGSASAIVPPPGTPDLSQMGPQASDFAPGARITRQGYVKADRELGLVADYQGEFADGATVGAAKFAYVYSDVALVEDAVGARLYFKAAEGFFSSPAYRRQFARWASRRVGRRSHVQPREVHAGPLHSLHVGDGSGLLALRARAHGVLFSADVVFVRVGCGVQSLELFATPGTSIGSREIAGLAGTLADRMRTGLSPLSTGAPMILIAPTSGVVPKVTGTKVIEERAAQGQTLIVTSDGTWSNCPTGFTYQWERCDATGANCAAVGAAVAETFGAAPPTVSGQLYTLTAADVGKRVRVSVTATNAAGSSKAATSTPTAIVQ
jgi:hypothetical protein